MAKEAAYLPKRTNTKTKHKSILILNNNQSLNQSLLDKGFQRKKP